MVVAHEHTVIQIIYPTDILYLNVVVQYSAETIGNGTYNIVWQIVCVHIITSTITGHLIYIFSLKG